MYANSSPQIVSEQTQSNSLRATLVESLKADADTDSECRHLEHA